MLNHVVLLSTSSTRSLSVASALAKPGPCRCGSPGASSTRHKVCIRQCRGLWIPKTPTACTKIHHWISSTIVPAINLHLVRGFSIIMVDYRRICQTSSEAKLQEVLLSALIFWGKCEETHATHFHAKPSCRRLQIGINFGPQMQKSRTSTKHLPR